MSITRAFNACLLVLAFFPALSAAPPAAAQDYQSAPEAGPSLYKDTSCGDLWHQRNAIYARNGYCFKTDRAIRVFGNENCRFEAEEDVRMSRDERRQIEIIRDVERSKGCQD